MKIVILLGLFFSLLLWNNCTDESSDCICTEEFRTYLVTVIDTLGNPVDSLQITVTNSRGKYYNFDTYSTSPFMQGACFVMTDGYESDFSTRPEKIIFQGTKDDKETIVEFYFNTDKCRCHVYKAAGPDTLVLK